MNIPDEATKRFHPERVLMGDGVSFYDINSPARVAFIAGAEWARRELLREADAAFDCSHDAGIFGYRARTTQEIRYAIRALADGDDR
jgi:hypothetical protein